MNFQPAPIIPELSRVTLAAAQAHAMYLLVFVAPAQGKSEAPSIDVFETLSLLRDQRIEIERLKAEKQALQDQIEKMDMRLAFRRARAARTSIGIDFHFKDQTNNK